MNGGIESAASLLISLLTLSSPFLTRIEEANRPLAYGEHVPKMRHTISARPDPQDLAPRSRAIISPGASLSLTRSLRHWLAAVSSFRADLEVNNGIGALPGFGMTSLTYLRDEICKVKRPRTMELGLR